MLGLPILSSPIIAVKRGVVSVCEVCRYRLCSSRVTLADAVLSRLARYREDAFWAASVPSHLVKKPDAHAVYVPEMAIVPG